MIYLDLGCHNGDTVIEFHEGKFGGIDPKGIKSIAFDPISTFKEEWKKVTAKYGTVFHNIAMFTHNGDIDFSQRDMASSVMREKTNYEKGERRKVDSLDIETFLKDYGDKEIVCRMDIEGAEYPILQKLIDLDLLKKFLYIEVEFHSHKMGEKFKKEQDRIIKNLRMSGTAFKEITS